MKVKVINKTNKGCTYKVLGLPSRYTAMARQEATWEEFNDTFELVKGEKYIYVLNAKSEKEIKEKNDFFASLMPHMLSARVKKDNIDNGLSADHAGWFNNIGMIGGAAEEYREKFGGAPIDFITEYKEYEKTVLEVMMFNDVGVGSIHTKNHDFHEDKWSDDEKEKVEKTLKRDEDYGSMSLGDMLKGKGIEIKEKI